MSQICTHLDQIVVDRDRTTSPAARTAWQIGGAVGASAGMPHLRPRRLLRFLARTATPPTTSTKASIRS